MLNQLLTNISSESGVEASDLEEVYKLVDNIQLIDSKDSISTLDPDTFKNELIQRFDLYEYIESIENLVMPFLISKQVIFVEIEAENGDRRLGFTFNLDPYTTFTIDILDIDTWSFLRDFATFSFIGTKLILKVGEDQILLNSIFPENRLETTKVFIMDESSEERSGNFDYSFSDKNLGISKHLDRLNKLISIGHEAGHCWLRMIPSLREKLERGMYLRSFFMPARKSVESTDEEFLKDLFSLKADEVAANMISQRIFENVITPRFPAITFDLGADNMKSGLNSYDEMCGIDAIESARALGLDLEKLFLFPEDNLDHFLNRQSQLEQLGSFTEYLISKFSNSDILTLNTFDENYGNLSLKMNSMNWNSQTTIDFSCSDFDGYVLGATFIKNPNSERLNVRLINKETMAYHEGNLSKDSNDLPISLYLLVTFIIGCLKDSSII